MNELTNLQENAVPQVFNFEGNNVRIIDRKGEPWWVLKDVCDILGLTHTTNTAQKLKEDELNVVQLHSGGQLRDMSIINEKGLYRVIMRSDKPDAERFQDWVFGEVLPSIRKTGSYAVTAATPETTIVRALELARTQVAELQAARKEGERLQDQIDLL
jgi:prophage antirepressor-like protein